MYAEQAKLKNSSQIVLPQGLVASGFFANVVLLAVDEELRDAIGTQIAPNFLLVDICRYVDDLRVVVALDGQTEHSCDPEKVVSKGNYIGYLKYLR